MLARTTALLLLLTVPADGLEALLRDREARDPGGKPGMRADLAAAVERLGDRKVDVLLGLFREARDDEVRDGAAFALGEIGDRRAVPPLLDDFLRHPRSCASGDALARIDDPRLAKVLIEDLESGDEDERERASLTMPKLRAKSALPLLVPLLKHESALMRARAVEGLGGIRDASAVPALIAALDDRNEGVIAYAARALGEIGDPAARAPLRTRLARGGIDLFTRNELARAIREIDAREKSRGGGVTAKP